MVAPCGGASPARRPCPLAPCPSLSATSPRLDHPHQWDASPAMAHSLLAPLAPEPTASQAITVTLTASRRNPERRLKSWRLNTMTRTKMYQKTLSSGMYQSRLVPLLLHLSRRVPSALHHKQISQNAHRITPRSPICTPLSYPALP